MFSCLCASIRMEQRFEDMEGKINDLRGEINSIKSEKHRLERQIQVESEELQEQLKSKTQRIIRLENEREQIQTELATKTAELDQELALKNEEIKEKNRKIDQLSKDLRLKTQNLQKLVNTELWSKNKEIAKMHNHLNSQGEYSQFSSLIQELNEIGIEVKITDQIIQLNYVNGSEPIDVKTMTTYIHKLTTQKKELENEVDYLKWLKIVSRLENDSIAETQKGRNYCEILKNYLVKFMRQENFSFEQKRTILGELKESRILSENFINILEGFGGTVRKSQSENVVDSWKNPLPTPSDSEVFSEPDRVVSMERMGIKERKSKSSRFSFNDSSDSDDLDDWMPCSKNDFKDGEVCGKIQELKETNGDICSELELLRKELVSKVLLDENIEEKLSPLIKKLEDSQQFCGKLLNTLKKRILEYNSLKKTSKQNSSRKSRLDKKISDVENMALEVAKQKAELSHYKENSERKTTEMIITLNRENDSLRAKIQKAEQEFEKAKSTISTLTKELDHLTLAHSQVLVENTKLTNDKLKLEQELRKFENRYEVTVRSLQEKFNKEVSDLNQMNDSHRERLQELESNNTELRRQVAVCEASDSAPSSSGVSTNPTKSTSKQSWIDMPDFQSFNNSQYNWWPSNTPSGCSKSSCSPDLGIESDAAVTSTRPLQDTLKITESMTNLLSDDDNNDNQGRQDVDSESPLPTEGQEDIESLKVENEALKRRLMKTRKTLEDTFFHLTASNKSKKNVEKAITRQLMKTKNVLDKARNYEETFDH